MYKLLVLLSIMLLAANCTKKPQPLPDPVCKAAFKAAGGTASIIASALQCENVGAITADLSEPILALGLCSETASQSTISDLVCPQISTIVTSMVTGSIPADWKCSTAVLSDIIKQQMSDACEKLIQ